MRVIQRSGHPDWNRDTVLPSWSRQKRPRSRRSLKKSKITSICCPIFDGGIYGFFLNENGVVRVEFVRLVRGRVTRFNRALVSSRSESGQNQFTNGSVRSCVEDFKRVSFWRARVLSTNRLGPCPCSGYVIPIQGCDHMRTWPILKNPPIYPYAVHKVYGDSLHWQEVSANNQTDSRGAAARQCQEFRSPRRGFSRI